MEWNGVKKIGRCVSIVGRQQCCLFYPPQDTLIHLGGIFVTTNLFNLILSVWLQILYWYAGVLCVIQI